MDRGHPITGDDHRRGADAAHNSYVRQKSMGGGGEDSLRHGGCPQTFVYEENYLVPLLSLIHI